MPLHNLQRRRYGEHVRRDVSFVGDGSVSPP